MDKKRMWIRITAVCLALCVIVGAILLYQEYEKELTEPDMNTHKIILTENGFDPSTITIRKGDTVVFTTIRNRPFWPASSFHPTHDLYASFDPQKPILPDAEWSFVFDTVGSWAYHDHLDPQHVGEVNVRSHWDLFPKKELPCEDLGGTEQMRCFDQKLKQYVLLISPHTC